MPDLSEYSRKELEAIIDDLISGTKRQLRRVLNDKIDSITEQLNQLDIDITNEDDDRYIEMVEKWAEKASKWGDSLDKLADIKKEESKGSAVDDGYIDSIPIVKR